jgi:predicted alpha/beta-hydrolase family hydrolase
MEHKFMEATADGLAGHGIATLRFNFPYMENKKKYPDPAPVAIKTVVSAVEFAAGKAKLPLFAGGKSFGGRMTSMAAAQKLIPRVKGLIYFGYPLHAPGKQSTERAEHLYEIEQPMLFLQGTRDTLAEINLIREVCDKLGKKTTLHEVPGGDHSFKVAKEKDAEVLSGLCETAAEWMKKHLT